jgi:hypothetical protein
VQNYLLLGLPGSLKPQLGEVQNYLLSGSVRKFKTSAERGAELLIIGLSGSLKPQPREAQNYLLSGPARKSKTSAERGAEILMIWACQEV